MTDYQAQIDAMRVEMKHGFAYVNSRIDSIDGTIMEIRKDPLSISPQFNKRLDEITENINEFKEKTNERFDQLDERFEQVDKRFEQVDKRFDHLEKYMNDGFDATHDAMERLFQHLYDKIEELRQK